MSNQFKTVLPYATLSNLDIPVRARNVLERYGIVLVSELRHLSDSFIRSLRGMLPADADEIIALLNETGLRSPNTPVCNMSGHELLASVHTRSKEIDDVADIIDDAMFRAAASAVAEADRDRFDALAAERARHAMALYAVLVSAGVFPFLDRDMVVCNALTRAVRSFEREMSLAASVARYA